MSRGAVDERQPGSGPLALWCVCGRLSALFMALSTSTLSQAWCKLFFNLGLGGTQVRSGASRGQGRSRG